MATISLQGNIGDCSIQWSSSDANVVDFLSFSDSQTIVKVQARQPGQATVSMSLGYGSQSSQVSCAIRVLPVRAHSLSLSPDPLTVPTGRYGAIRAIIVDSTGVELFRPELSWISSDTTLATVQKRAISDNMALVHGHELGNVTISASFENHSASAVAKVVVQPLVLYGIWGTSENDIYCVGYYGTIIHFDGNQWTDMSVDTYSEHLMGIWGSSGRDIYAVGARRIRYHYDGESWTIQSGIQSGFSSVNRAIWGSSSADIFVAGSHPIHFDGNQWHPIEVPSYPTQFDVWGSNSAHVFIVGDNGIVSTYDGQTWTALGSGTSNNLYGVWGSSASDVYSVGSEGTIVHFDGTDWAVVPSGITRRLWDVWGSGATDVFAVGWEGTILHFDGNGWALMDSGSKANLTGVWGSSGTNVYAVGYLGNGGVILHFDGQVWETVSVSGLD